MGCHRLTIFKRVRQFFSSVTYLFPEKETRIPLIIFLHLLQLLGEILSDHSNSSVMVHYVSSLDNMRVLMNLLRDSNKTIQLDAFQVFELFIDSQNKPPEIVSILVKNRSKLLQFFGDFELGKNEACAAFDVFENPNVLCLIQHEVFEEEKIKLSKKSPYFNPKMNHVQVSTTLTFSVIDEFVHIW
ncbi:hypothetical protein RHMOL_Rhmol04G0062200 [Rhododendron molle]|uniref:Uncharacterized protein n=1 Tax=Rhododendron molle TaxID=49168 RepID=A0ACC0NXL6_RHOML|nr:hypothetical protein RHMOL_Rhmol04G0062200 [Rhododendron molle]